MNKLISETVMITCDLVFIIFVSWFAIVGIDVLFNNGFATLVLGVLIIWYFLFIMFGKIITLVRITR
jgi:hypothetical protein